MKKHPYQNSYMEAARAEALHLSLSGAELTNLFPAVTSSPFLKGTDTIAGFCPPSFVSAFFQLKTLHGV